MSPSGFTPKGVPVGRVELSEVWLHLSPSTDEWSEGEGLGVKGSGRVSGG